MLKPAYKSMCIIYGWMDEWVDRIVHFIYTMNYLQFQQTMISMRIVCGVAKTLHRNQMRQFILKSIQCSHINNQFEIIMTHSIDTLVIFCAAVSCVSSERIVYRYKFE